MLKCMEGLNYFCWRKIPIKSRKKARATAKKMTKKYGEEFNAYKCTICGKYHVGRDDKWRKRKENAHIR